MLREPLTIAIKEAQPPLVLALDIGSTGTRAFVFDVRGRPLRGTARYVVSALRVTNDGEASASADEGFAAVCQVIDASLRALGRRGDELRAVAMSTFWHSLLGVDARGRPTTRVLTWADTRARLAAASLRAELDVDAVHARTGCTIHASYWPAKLRYLRESAPSTFARTSRWMSLGEYVYARLLGEARAAHGMASATGVYDQRAREWDRAFLERLGVGASGVSLVSDEPHVGLRRAFAVRWPALADARWVPAIGDGACSNVGAGAVGERVAALFVGTSGAMRVVRETDAPPVVKGGWTYRLDRRRVVAGGALSNGGNVVWWLRGLFPKVDPARLWSRTSRPLDGHGLTALPLLAGDRSPSWNDDARAAIAGISLATSAEDLAQAMLEGVAYRAARLWSALDAVVPGIERVTATGGTLLALPWLLQLFADALGRPLVASASGEGSARGAALVALERIGAIADLAGVRSPLGRTYRPRAAAHEALRRGMERQARLESALIMTRGEGRPWKS